MWVIAGTVEERLHNLCNSADVPKKRKHLGKRYMLVNDISPSPRAACESQSKRLIWLYSSCQLRQQKLNIDIMFWFPFLNGLWFLPFFSPPCKHVLACGLIFMYAAVQICRYRNQFRGVLRRGWSTGNLRNATAFCFSRGELIMNG